MEKVLQTYIWLDANHGLRSKSKVTTEPSQIYRAPQPWAFDGSSTGQSTGEHSDLILNPIQERSLPKLLNNTVVEERLVLCEVNLPDGSPHVSNTYRALKEVNTALSTHLPWFGIEQEYYIEDSHGGTLKGYEVNGELQECDPQGPYYCSAGQHCYGSDLAEAHLGSCIEASILIYGINSEVGPAQWEFQIGTGDPVTVANDLWLARFLLERHANKLGYKVVWHPKPYKGDWNGSGCHTNYSTVETRAANGLEIMHEYIRRLGAQHNVHIANYGRDIKQRLTGQHETCSYTEFRSGACDRGASVRIPLHCQQAGHGYLEDRRPCSNMDPYTVLRLILETTLA